MHHSDPATQLERTDEPYRVAAHGAVIVDTAAGVTVDWSRDLKEASTELGDAIGSCDRAAVLAIPGAADALALMQHLLEEINERLK